MQQWIEHRNTEMDADMKTQHASQQDKGRVEKSNKDESFKYNIAKVENNDFAIQEEKAITDEDFVIAVRPEAIKIDDNGTIEGIIYGAMPTGMESTVKIRIGDYLLTAVIFGGVIYQIGAKVRINIDGSNILLYDCKSGKYIASGSVQIR